ncbi:MAG: hypothetical protein KUG77_17030 [Nannocystaceae bacterium]|nr:hypothetical protein [Nannocystaceae bacterium]
MSSVHRALVCLLAIAAACDRADTEGSDPPAPPPAPPSANDTKAPAPIDANTPDPAPPNCHDGIDALSQLEGETEPDLIALYGEPNAKKTFKMADCCHEFEIELYNTYPPGEGHDAVEIHQLTWHDGNNLLTVWAHRPKSDWVILDTLCYLEGDEF